LPEVLGFGIPSSIEGKLGLRLEDFDLDGGVWLGFEQCAGLLEVCRTASGSTAQSTAFAELQVGAECHPWHARINGDVQGQPQ
jgi:hypothetical protein